MKRIQIPRSIRVGSAVYRVQVKPLRSCVGECHIRARRIDIDPSALERPDYAVNTLLHEVMHAIWYEWGIKDSDMDDFSFNKGYATEERAINGMCNGLLTVFAQNPKLFALVAKYRTQGKGD